MYTPSFIKISLAVTEVCGNKHTHLLTNFHIFNIIMMLLLFSYVNNPGYNVAKLIPSLYFTYSIM